jgi:hypothetical protein
MTATALDLSQAARRFAPALSGYPAALRGSAIRTWRARMVNEYSSARVFEALGQQLAEAGFEAKLVRTCLGFAGEERRHGVLCGAVVVALGGEARASIDSPATFPTHPDAPPRAAALRNVIHVCCLSETVAVSLIGDERAQMPNGPLCDLLTSIYADEVGHARFGWRLLERVAGTLTATERLAVERYLPVALSQLEHHELAHLPDVDAPPCGEQLGLCSGRDARQLFYDTVETVIIPGLQRWFSLASIFRAGDASCRGAWGDHKAVADHRSDDPGPMNSRAEHVSRN